MFVLAQHDLCPYLTTAKNNNCLHSTHTDNRREGTGREAGAEGGGKTMVQQGNQAEVQGVKLMIYLEDTCRSKSAVFA